MTTLDLGNLKSILKAALGSLDSNAVAEMWRKSRNEFYDRFINEFTYVDLADARNTINRPLPLDRLSYETAFVELAIRGSEHWGEQQRISNVRDFYGLNDMTRFIGAIIAPALIYFSDDDPVLSREWPRTKRLLGDDGPRVGLERVLEFVKSSAKSPNSTLTVFNPPLGGHTGVLVDPIYCSLLSSFFVGRSCPELQR